MSKNKEYAVFLKGHPEEPHRGPWTKEKCEEWVKECEDMDMDFFYIASRTVSEWDGE